MTLDLQQAKLDPGSIFKSVNQIVISKELSLQQKIDLLERWAYDEKELAVAEEENMLCTSKCDYSDKLAEIIKAIILLKAMKQKT